MCRLPSPPQPRHCMVCVVVFVCLCQTVYVLGEGGGTYAYACVKCVGCYECICHALPPPPPTQVDYLFFVLYLFYQSRLERFVF